MKKNLIMVIIVLGLVGAIHYAVGAANESTTYNYIYKGENNCWEAEFTAIGDKFYPQTFNKVKDTGQFEYTLSVSYKGNIAELENMKSLGISYQANSIGGGSLLNFLDDAKTEKTYSYKFQGDKLYFNKDEIIKVVIEKDNEMQELELEPFSTVKI